MRVKSSANLDVLIVSWGVGAFAFAVWQHSFAAGIWFGATSAFCLIGLDEVKR